MELQETQNSQNNLRENKFWELSLYDLKTYYKSTVIKTVCHTGIRTHIDKWNRIMSAEIKPIHLWSTKSQQGSHGHWMGKKQSSTNGSVWTHAKK